MGCGGIQKRTWLLVHTAFVVIGLHKTTEWRSPVLPMIAPSRVVAFEIGRPNFDGSWSNKQPNINEKWQVVLWIVRSECACNPTWMIRSLLLWLMETQPRKSSLFFSGRRRPGNDRPGAQTSRLRLRRATCENLQMSGNSIAYILRCFKNIGPFSLSIASIAMMKGFDLCLDMLITYFFF